MWRTEVDGRISFESCAAETEAHKGGIVLSICDTLCALRQCGCNDNGRKCHQAFAETACQCGELPNAVSSGLSR